jgi:DNA replication protein DnaC
MLQVLETSGGIDRASIDSMLEWATPRQIEAVDRLLATELGNRETAKHGRPVRRARFPVTKSLERYDSANVKLPERYAKEQLLDFDFTAKAHDLVLYGKTGHGMNVRFHQTAELVLQLGKAKRDGTLDAILKDLAKADLSSPGELGHTPLRLDGARLPCQIIAGSYERRSIINTRQHRIRQMGTILADDKLVAACQSTASSTTDASSNLPAPAGASAKPPCSTTRNNSPTNNYWHAP